MRQAGFLAAACLYAMDHHVERLAEDHANAKLLAAAVADTPGLTLVPSEVETNLVWFEVAPEVGTARQVAGRLRSTGFWWRHSGRLSCGPARTWTSPAPTASGRRRRSAGTPGPGDYLASLCFLNSSVTSFSSTVTSSSSVNFLTTIVSFFPFGGPSVYSTVSFLPSSFQVPAASCFLSASTTNILTLPSFSKVITASSPAGRSPLLLLVSFHLPRSFISSPLGSGAWARAETETVSARRAASEVRKRVIEGLGYRVRTGPARPATRQGY